MRKYLIVAVMSFCLLSFVGAARADSVTITSPGSTFTPVFVDQAYSNTIAVTGGVTPYTFSVISGSLPTGLSLDSSTGVISGTPTVTGTYNFTIQVLDSSSLSTSQGFSFSIAPQTDGFVYTRTPSGSPAAPPLSLRIQGAFGIDFCQDARDNYYRVFAREGTTTQVAIMFHSQGDIVDDNISYSPPPGTIEYIKIFCGGTSVGDVGPNLNLDGGFDIIPAEPTIVDPASTLTPTFVNQPYTRTFSIVGSYAPYTFALTAGSLPAGISLDTANGILSGTPTVTGTYHFTIQVTGGNSLSSTEDFSFAIASPSSGFIYTRTPGGDIILSPLTLRIQGAFGIDLCQDVRDNYYRIYVYHGSVTQASIQFHDQGDLIDDTINYSTDPTTITRIQMWCGGTSVGDVGPNPNLDGGITVLEVIIPDQSLSGGVVGSGYSYTMQNLGGTAPLSWSIISGTLPSGLSIGVSTGVISGTPTAAGVYDFTIQVSDTKSGIDSKAFSINIISPPTITTTLLPAATVSGAYSQTLTLTPGTSPYTWSVLSGSLPTGLSLNASTGVISGTTTTVGTYSFTVQVTDSNSLADTQALSILVNAVPTITRSNLPDVKVGHNYSQTATASGGTAALMWSISSGSLPPGLSINSSNGLISGTATTPTGTYSITVRVVDANGVVATKNLSIQVKP